MNEKGDMCAQYYNYRVEFQLRGAGHIHGTIWIDWDLMDEKMRRKKENSEYDLDEHVLDVNNIKEGFENIKEERLGIEGNEEEDEPQLRALSNFIDEFISCSLKDPSTLDIVRSVNMHKHTKPCQKKPPCRFRFPRYALKL